MRLRSALILIVVAASGLSLTGCKKESAVDASQALQQSFDAAEPAVKQAIDTANANLRSGNVNEAAKSLAPVVSGRNLTAAQKEAVGLALKQMNQAIADNPSLDTKEMYELRAKMFRAVDGGSRF